MQLVKLRETWPQLREKLRVQFIPEKELTQMLDAAGAPTTPDVIGITPSRLRETFLQAGPIRRRYTVLDMALRAGLPEPSLEALFRH